MNWKVFRRRGSWPNFKALSRHSTGGAEENHENLNQDSWYTGRDLKTGLPEYETRVLSIRT
jgi:hypothetical protein